MTVSESDDVAARSPTGGSIYVYGVARAGIGAGGAGVLGGAVTTIESGEVSAIVSDVDHENVRAKRRDLLLHAEVLQRAFAAGPVLPFRFGTVFPSARALADELLSPRQTELLELLSRFDGNGELRVRAAYHDQEAVFAEMVRGDPTLAALRGRTDSASLLELGEAVAATYSARRQADADAIVSRLAEHALDVHVDPPTSEVDVVRASFLVPVRKTAAFDAALESVALRNRHLIDFNCTGPVPPHSFVSLGGR